jgi:bifunctional DNA-binding transcriptional regulator/antitoxin component of YhaV-PrlF toxin-antitoxin module
MHATKVTSGNRVTLVKAVREAMAALPGDKIGFLPDGRGFKLVVVKRDPYATGTTTKHRPITDDARP